MEENDPGKRQKVGVQEAVTSVSPPQMKSTRGEGLTSRQNIKEGSERKERAGENKIK